MAEVVDAIVAGGGISGLAAAWRLTRAGKRVALLEAETRLGGSIHTLDVGGRAFDAGATSTLLKSERVRSFLRESGIEALLVRPPKSASRRFILSGGRLRPLPLSPFSFLASPLFTAGDKLRLLGEPWRKRFPADGEETIAAFVRRRLGESFLENAVGPFVSGVFAGDPERLSVRRAVPAIWRLEQEHGGLIRGALARRTAGTGPRGELVSTGQGMGALPRAIGERLPAGTVRLGHTIQRVSKAGDRYSMEGSDGTGSFSLEAPRLVVALPARVLPALLAPLAPEAALFGELPYAPVTTVFTVWPATAFARPPEGFGFLRSLGERSARLLGCLFSSALWPGRARPGEVALTSFYGGRRDPDVTSLSEDAIRGLAREEAARFLGAQGSPIEQAVRSWRQAIPQLEVGHGRFLASAAQIQRSHPGLRLIGNWLEGVSVADCLDRALAIDPS